MPIVRPIVRAGFHAGPTAPDLLDDASERNTSEGNISVSNVCIHTILHWSVSSLSSLIADQKTLASEINAD